MDQDNLKYYEPLRLMMPIRYQYIKKIVLEYINKDLDNAFINSKVLDLGCGTGEFTKIISELGSNCIGIDSLDNFKIKNSKKLNFIKSDIFQYLVKKSKYKFDYIFCFEVLEHLNEKEKEKFFRLIKNKINKNGILFISTINKNWISKKLVIDFAERFLRILPNNTHDYNLFIDPINLSSICKKNNLKIIDIKGLSYNPLFKNFSFINSNLVNYICAIKN